MEKASPKFLVILFVLCTAQVVLANVNTVATMDASWSVSGDDFAALDQYYYPSYQWRLESYYDDAASVPHSVLDQGSGSFGISSVFATTPTAAQMDFDFANGASNGTADFTMNASGGAEPTEASALIEATAYAQKAPSHTSESFMSMAHISNILMWFPDTSTAGDLVFDFDATLTTNVTQSGSLPWSGVGQYYIAGDVRWINDTGMLGHNVFFNITDTIHSGTDSDTINFSLSLNPYIEGSDFYDYQFPDGFIPTYGRINLTLGVDCSAYEYGPVDDPGNPIPAPGAVLLGSIGMAGIGWLRRRRKI